MTKSKEYELSYYMRELVRAMMKRDGRNFLQCELCPAIIPEGKYQLHHMKYEGATYYDMRIVCGKCNNAPINKNLA